MSVIIQEVVPSYSSGVAFSNDPLNHQKGQTLIESTFGLGLALVSGVIEPDRFSVNTEGIINQEIAEKRMMFWRQQGFNNKMPGDVVNIQIRGKHYPITFLKYSIGDIAFMRINSPLCDTPSLIGSEIEQVLLLIEKVKILPWAKDVDVEWCLTHNKIYALQARPITNSLQESLALISDNDREPSLQGRSISKGIAYGRIAFEGDPEVENCIVIVRYILPKHLTMIHKSAGVIVENGGILSHGAILCREIGKPCIQITNIHKMQKMLSGKIVELDATRGKLFIHS